MRFGLMYDFRNPRRWYIEPPRFYRAMLDQMVEAETLGFDHVWLTEHHFTEDAYNPASLSTAAAVAALTSRIRIGTFVMLMPFIHPVRAAEDVVLADILSNGRFDLGVGQGYTHEEFNAFCVDRRERAPRLEEGVELMRRLFTEDDVSFDGRFTRVSHMTLAPKAVQQPHPPLWIGARGPKAIRRAARLGAHLMTTLGPDPAPLYLETLRELGRNPDDFRIAQLRMVYCADSEDQAWDDVAEHLFHVFGYYERVLGEAADVEGDDQPLPFRRAGEIRGSAFADAALMIGTPDQVAAKLERFRAEYACTDFILSTHFAGLDPAKSGRSNALFAREVMPRFRR
ncbi:MAG: LLM class flavin-dependent oxidoreductase [Gammaproteobacteria bacterium]|nr:LLM class flavin-dependent oxidoreductase [Gammaproteobacteria bacterium]